MAEDLASRLLPGSFRGVPFLVKDILSVQFGRKVVLNEIPDSDKRTIQDLGLLNKNFTMIVSTGGVNGQHPNYFADRNNLIAAMERPGPGILSHPLFGSIEVSPATASLTENMRAFGDAEYELKFHVAQAQSAPFDFGDPASILDDRGIVVNAALNANFANTYKINPRFGGNIADGINQAADFFDLATAAVKQIGVSQDQLSTVNALINLFGLNAVQLVLAPIRIASSVLALFNALLDLGLSPESNIALFSKFYNFCDDSVLVNPNNRELAERNRNRLVFCETVQAHALVQSYRSVGSIAFNNVLLLDRFRNILDDQFERVILDTVLDGESQDDLEALRVDASLFFSQQSVAVFNLVDFNTPTLPITVLTYNLYNSTDNDQQLIDLNNIQDVGHVSGQLKILGA